MVGEKPLMNNKDAYIEQLENTIKKLQLQVDNLTEMILILRKEKFGSSSEKTPKDDIEGQLHLFNEAEAYSDSPGLMSIHWTQKVKLFYAA